MNYPFNQQKNEDIHPILKNKVKIITIQKNSVHYYNESTSSPSLDEVIEPVYNESSQKRRKGKRKSNQRKVNKPVQFATQVPRPASITITIQH